MYNHLMDSCSYLRKQYITSRQICTPLTPVILHCLGELFERSPLVVANSVVAEVTRATISCILVSHPLKFVQAGGHTTIQLIANCREVRLLDSREATLPVKEV